MVRNWFLYVLCEHQWLSQGRLSIFVEKLNYYLNFCYSLYSLYLHSSLVHDTKIRKEFIRSVAQKIYPISLIKRELMFC